MNVCMLAYAHYVNDARIKSYVRTLESAGHHVDIIALRADGESSIEERPSGTIFRVMSKYQGQSTVMYAWSYLSFFFRSLWLLTRLSVRRRYALVHVHNMPNLLVFAAAAPKILGARLMLDVHDLMPVNYMAKFNAGQESLPIKMLKAEQWMSTWFATHVFCADHNQCDYLVDECKVAPGKITVLMNLPNGELFRRTTVKENNDVFRIVYHGTIAHRLGIDLMVRAMAKVTERIPAGLWIYGSGDYLPEALALRNQLGLETKIHFSRTFFPVEQIPEMISSMDLGIIGNRRNLACDKYMLPVKLLEYVYLGVPVVAPRLAVIARYFDDTMVRFYEPENVEEMADAIVELFYSPQKRDALVRAAHKFYEEHNIKAQADRYLALVTGSQSAFSDCAPGVSCHTRL
jgi:glycosyltransferase involved in cell wall biosynthesis